MYITMTCNINRLLFLTNPKHYLQLKNILFKAT